MNELECYIEEVLEIKEIPFEVDLEGKHYKFKNAVEAMLKVHCYGSEDVVRKVYTDKKDLEKDLERGYYMETF